MTKKRVVVTGLGCLTPLGNSIDDFWDALLAGKSGASIINFLDIDALPVKFSASVKDFDVEKGVDVVITVDVKDGNPETFKHTAGYFSLKEFNNFKVYRTDAPEPEPVIEPEPVVEPDPEPDEPDNIDDPQWGF